MRAGGGEFHPGFENHPGGGRGVGEADEPGGGGEVVLGPFVREVGGNEKQRPAGTHREQRRRHLAPRPQGEPGKLLRPEEQIVERWRGCWL